MDNVVNTKRLFFIPYLKQRIVCKKDFGEIFRDLNEVIIRSSSLSDLSDNIGKPVFSGNFSNYKFSLFPYHSSDAAKYMDVPATHNAKKLNLMAPFFSGKFEVIPGHPVVLDLRMECSPVHIMFLIAAVLFWIVALGTMNLPMVFGAAVFTLITQGIYYQTAKSALQYLLDIVGGEDRD